MKKILTMFVVAAMAIAANAAATSWKLTAGNMYDKTGTAKFTGAFELFATGGDLTSDVSVYTQSTVANGTISQQVFDTNSLTAGESYKFYYILTDDAGAKFTSATTANAIKALETGAANVNFGNQASATQAAGAWQAAPEPTSGLLLLLGVAGLALKRKRA